MVADTARPAPPSDDKRWKIVDAAMRKLGYRGNALIETLHSVQESFGYLDDDALKYVAECLRVPLSKVYGVATFYHFFTLKPQGKHTCVVCMGTACYIKGAGDIIDTIKKIADIAPGETTTCGKVSLLTARCIGACGLAPAVVMDGDVSAKSTPEQIGERIKEWLKDDT